MKCSILLALVFSVGLLVACAPGQASPPTLMPIDTVVALTMAAIPRTDTPTAIPTETPTPTIAHQITATALEEALLSAVGYCLPPNERINARVTRVLAGDTIEVAINNTAMIVHYIGVDAPPAENLDYSSQQALARNRQLVAGQVVTLIKDVSDVDANGEWWRYVLSNGVFVNFEMVRSGYALAAPEPPDVSCQDVFLQAHIEAQTTLAGLWAPTPLPTATPLPPATATSPATATKAKPPPCNCQGPDLRCKSFATHAEAQACYNYCLAQGYGDVFGLDNDGDGQVCMGLP